MAIHQQLQPAARTPHVDFGASHIGQGQRDLGDCFSCHLPAVLHFKVLGSTERLIGCDGAAIAARVQARAQQPVANLFHGRGA